MSQPTPPGHPEKPIPPDPDGSGGSRAALVIEGVLFLAIVLVLGVYALERSGAPSAAIPSAPPSAAAVATATTSLTAAPTQLPTDAPTATVVVATIQFGTVIDPARNAVIQPATSFASGERIYWSADIPGLSKGTASTSLVDSIGVESQREAFAVDGVADQVSGSVLPPPGTWIVRVLQGGILLAQGMFTIR